MIENRNGTSKSMEKALKNYEQAKQRVANEKKKQNEKKRKAEVTYSPNLLGAHRYTTRGGMCALRGLLRRALSVLRQPTGEATLSLRRKKRAYPFVNFAFR